ncbi:ROK family protein, partial [Enterococcus faecium]|uniref:ROK family protein n=1 Tax=Enterococcus faecium TaxID=1352 RepID=UPI003CC60ACB
LAVFDIGGTSVKHGIWEKQALSEVSAFPTPDTFEKLLEKIRQVIDAYDRSIEGIAISSPGAVDQPKRQILGVSPVE